MDQSVELKKFSPIEGQKYKTLYITDIMLHTAVRRTSLSVGQKMKESLETGEPGRAYSPLERSLSEDQKTFAIQVLKSDPDFIKAVQEYERQGYKVVLAFPAEGIPIFAGEDTKQFLRSKNGKRFLRGFAKEKTES